MGFWEMKAALDWQVAMGLDEAIADAPLDRFAESEAAEKAATAPKPAEAAPVVAEVAGPDPVAVAMAAAEAASDLEGLRAAMDAFEFCDLKRGARQLVFSDGIEGARVMIVGEAPGRDEDREGRPFVGRAGQLLDLMFSHIGLSRTSVDKEHALYITNVLPWRPPQNRDPKPDEVAMMLPFLTRHIELSDPDVLIAMGNHATGALLGRTGITRLRGTWAEAMGRPVLPMFHPAYLLRNPAAKREAWADLLAVKARLKAGATR
ncbi:uracil-DNA glycosylase [Alphaproteobacteria bacterium GH1-50]|uniref:Type-4 uracil-DNA glycosylase n=1 Tax=Kangsaoukella pontilimi TaxID=2691042 RepID=A0A7C9IIE6_9RHOB|nr:uracil-DNA glycosylase [Kangsaoukella pontilimi]MXQ09309.1 uracil-DNA glycosylase [Kangsaoukella pontilimi]